MTLPTGNPAPGADRSRAFTLIELILVMTLLLVVTSLSAPQLAHFFRGRTLDSEARRFLAMTRYGQNRAVSEGIPMVLWIDSNTRTYGLEAQAGYSLSQDSKAVEFVLGKDLKLEPVLPQRPTGLANQITRSSRQPIQPVAGTLPAIVFLPDGSITLSSPEIVTLTEKDADAVHIGLSDNRLRYEIQTNQVRTATR